jgi:hypothetical protein
MTLDYSRPYFKMTIAACRHAGAIGGRRSGRTRRLRQASQARATEAIAAPQSETVHEASMLLDEKFPHLRNAWARTNRRPAA